MPLKDGQSVLIKRFLVGIVLEERPGDKELPQEQRHYMVHVPEGTFVFSPSDLEPLEEPDDTLAKPGAEWSAEFARWLEAGKRFLTDKTDRTAWDEFSAVGTKLGFYIPIKED